MCLSTTGCRPGSIKVYDSLFQRVGQIAILHSCHMLMQAGNSTSFINEKVQKQINTSDCGLVALAFATDLCQGLDPVMEAYDQQKHASTLHQMPRFRKEGPFPKSIIVGSLPCH